jgi:hypothetical protein
MRLYTQGSVSLNSVTSSVVVLCPLLETISVEKKRTIISSAPKMDRFVTRKRDIEKLLEIDVLFFINSSSLF